MFERFTERARQVVVLAQEEARNGGYNYIGTEHILLGLLREEEGLAARALDGFGITIEQAREDVRRLAPPTEAPEVIEGQIPFTPRGKRVLELSLREALSLGHNYIGTEHVLLGLVREEQGLGMRVLLDRGLDGERVRSEIVRVLSGSRFGSRPRGELTPEEIRSGLGKLRVFASTGWLKGILAGYDFVEDRCEVIVTNDGIDGRVTVARTYLVCEKPGDATLRAADG